MHTGKNKLDTASMTKIALLVALLSVASYLVIPLPFTPIVLSMHTVMVNLIGLTLKPSHAAYTILVYLIMGLIGLPIFSGGSAGPEKLFGPTGGFYFGFLFAVIAISICKGKKSRFIRYAAVTIGLGIPIQHLFAIAFMCFYNGFQIKAAALTVSLPFIPGDIIKCLLASALAVALNKINQSTSVLE
ncbi:MAG: biotin transporter BioY [Clostridiales bacterium]|nr:biotin transporter BioY [Clostridiales bacterium]